jgi:hypothetical protein
MNTPEAWLKDGLHLMWPESIPAKDYQRVIELMFKLGEVVKGTPKRRRGETNGVEANGVHVLPKTARRKRPSLQKHARELMKKMGEFSYRDVMERTGVSSGSAVFAARSVGAVKAGTRKTKSGHTEMIWKVPK